MILSNKEKVRKCIILENERYFDLYPPKQPIFNFELKSEYRNKVIAKRESEMLAKLDELAKSNQISLYTLWVYFGGDDVMLLSRWITTLSSNPDYAYSQFHKIYKECTEQLKNTMKKDAQERPHRRISYVPVMRLVLDKLDSIDIGII